MSGYLSICKCTNNANHLYDLKNLNKLSLYSSVMLSGKGM